MEKFRMTTALGDHMVLQREARVRLWGKGAPEGAPVHAKLGPFTGEGVGKQNGQWELFLPAMPANAVPGTLTVTCGEDTVTAKDVLVGDVWLVNGQSNAECTMAAANANGDGIYDGDRKDISAADNIRVLKQTRSCATDRPETMLTPQFDLASHRRSSWRRLKDAEGTDDLSAMGFFFARKLSRTLSASVPQGLVVVASGGSPVMELIPPELVKPMGYQKPEKTEIPLAGIYNALYAPVQPMTFRGMLFYQGESEQWRHEAYPYQMNWYITELRRRSGFCFPFYYVQLSSHVGPAYENWKLIEEVRYEQTYMLQLIENSAMVVSMDVGGKEFNHDWAHPPYKKPVGERLADLVLAREYGIGNEEYVSSPIPTDCRFEEDKVIIRFTHVGDQLVVRTGEKPVGFEVADATGKFRKATGKLTEDSVILRAKNATAVRYAHMHDATPEHANLSSSTGYPAAAFQFRK